MPNIYKIITARLSKIFSAAAARLSLAAIILVLASSHALHAQKNLWTYANVIDPAWDGIYTWTEVSGGMDIDDSDPYVPVYPEEGDTLIITNNITVYLPEDIDVADLTIIFENGGLDLRTYTFTGEITEMRQTPGDFGTLKIGSAGYYPDIAGDNFTEAEGATVEYYNFSGTLVSTPSTYNNLMLNNTDGENHIFTLGNDLTVNNDLTLHNTAGMGNLTFTAGNSATPLNISTRNLTVGANTTLQTGNFDAVHDITVRGNMTSNGTVTLTNQDTRYRESTSGAAELTFTGTTNNYFDGDGPRLRLYRLIIDKGNDHTFTLDANPQNMELWYRTDLANGDSGDSDNPIINKALWIKNGTLRLGDNISIEKLAGEDLHPSLENFVIPRNGCLWIDGAEVNVMHEDDSPQNTAFKVIGKLRITGGILNTNKSAGFIFSEPADINIHGGTTTTSQFRQSDDPGPHVITFEITAGIFTADGSGLTNDSYARFSLPLGTQNFRMSGGTINLSNPTTTGILAFGLDPSNHNVSGGTINISHTGTSSIASTVPLFNLNLQQGTLSIEDIEGIGLQPLVVNNNLTLESGTTLTANNQDVWIAGNFIIESGATYNHGTNTTRFFRSGAANNNGTTITNNSGTTPLTFNNVSIEKSDNISTYNNAKTVRFPTTGTPAADIEGALSFNTPYQTLDLGNSRLKVQDDINVNRDSRITNDPANGILLQPEPAQNQVLSLARLTSLNNFELDNTENARLLRSAAMGSLTLTEGSLYIGNRRLTLSEPVEVAEGTDFSENRMVSTNGMSGELRYIYSNVGAGTYLYPVGAGAAPLPEGEEELDESEDFSTDVFSNGWTSTPLTTPPTNWVVDAGSALYDENGGRSARMESPEYDLSGYTTVYLNFREQRTGPGGNIDELIVEYDAGSGWTELASYTNETPSFTFRSITLPAGALQSNVKFGFRAISAHNNSETRVDDFQLTNLAEAAEKKYTPFTAVITGDGNFTAQGNYIGVIPVNSIHPL
ncbi:hypothetical protein, partial [Desulfonatronospira sp.]|uniref:hypothetical protein n=1 Tax=Desulfonatronospira sp. TaxID=1962951 RepID=UPI0025B8EFD2